jgi:hypothetical protein
MEAFNFFSFIGWRLRSGLLQKKISGISNKMFTQTVRELKRRPYFQKIFPWFLPGGIQIDERGRSLDILQVWISGALKIILI